MENNIDTKKVILVKYGEISLRKGNRAFYEHKIMKTIRYNLKELDSNLRVLREQGRFLIEDVDGDIDTSAVLARVKHILGITGFAICVKTSLRHIDDLCKIGYDFFTETAASAKSFKVNTKRSDKRYPINSREISAAIGDCIWNNTPGLCVDLHNPEVILNVEIRNNVYFYVNSIPGVGGLPYGSSGKGVLLLSGGLDSPIAGYLTARRGVDLFPIYFHSPPFVSERAADKVHDLAQVLARYGGNTAVNVIPFTDVQLFLKDNVQEEKLTIMLKRAMLRIASAYAKNIGAQCLITGDSIGQVASQTIQSLAAVHTAADYTVLRPLAAMDKQEIIDIARDIGTFDISTRPYEDCCTLFVAKHPENKPNTNVIERIEDKLLEQLTPLLNAALENAVIAASE
ncbi:MAG: tRNA 4-thiouridine(8) synthase ThiI [Defluviitaleaceae bacterium]|nr:tRNA 4-thiouridine(8) synthase ThiI [Defluviitaleaceae bacterium]